MNILNKLTNKNLKLNKNRTLVTIIGISLATALICAVLGMITSFQATMKNVAKTEVGDYHVKFENIPTNQAKYITENNAVEKYYLQSDLGYAKLDKSENEYKPYAYIVGMSSESLSNNGLELTSGRLPENSNEIIIEDTMLSGTLVNYKVGDTITLNYGTRVDASGNVLSQSDMLQTAECESESKCDLSSTETITNTTKHTYTIVGIISRVNTTMEGYNAPGYTMITYLSNDELMKENSLSIAVKYKNSSSYEASSTYIIDVLKSNTGNTYKYSKNKNLLEAEGNLDSETLKALYWIGIIIVGIIMVTGIFTTRNAFAISVSEKTKQYGMLSSIGATSKQIKRSVVNEGLIIGLFAIPLGLLIGILATFILTNVVNFYGDSMFSSNSKLVFNIPYVIYIIDAVVSFITIYLSCVIPAHRASKISPIEAIRATDDIKVNPKKLRTSKLISNTLGIGGIIADKNLKRNKKKYSTTIISLVISIATFITLFSFVQYGTELVSNVYKDYSFNILLRDVKKSNYKEYANVDDSTSSYYVMTSGTYNINDYCTQEGIDSIKKLDGTDNQNLTIVVYNDDYFKEYLKSIGAYTDDYKSAAVLYDKMTTMNKGKASIIHQFKNINSITLKTYDDNNSSYDTVFNIVKKTEVMPMGSEYFNGSGGLLIVSEDYFKSTNQTDITSSITTGYLAMNSKDASSTEKALTELKKSLNDKSIYVSNIESEVKQEKDMITLISIFLYGFIIVISLIGVTNVFNTITTSMMLRSKEFAMLKSIGMTHKEFNHMIRLESIMYGLKSLIIGSLLGLLGSYGIYAAIGNKIDLGYIFPGMGIIISIIFVVIIIWLTMRYSLNRVNKQNIIETIRQENI